MYRLLIVDDEPIIVDNLYGLFRNTAHLDLEVYRAYKVTKALELLESTRIDLLLSDIRMPGMTGIELYKQALIRWPRCRVVFLTGYNDFTYAQQAIRTGGVVDYLLKNKDDDMIVRSVEKALVEIGMQRQAENHLRKATMKLQVAEPVLRQQFFLAFLHGDGPAADELAKHFERLEISLASDIPVYMMLGRIDEGACELSAADRQLMLYAVQNIVAEYMSPSAAFISVELEGGNVIWFIQPKELETGVSPEQAAREEKAADAASLNRADSDIIWRNLISRIYTIAEAAQETSRSLLKLSLSFAMSDGPCLWKGAGAKAANLKLLLGRGFGFDRELLLKEGHMAERDGGDSESGLQTAYDSRNLNKQLNMLESYLESGQKESFLQLYYELTQAAGAPKPSDLTEIYYTLSIFFAAKLNRFGLFYEFAMRMDAGKLARYDRHRSWAEAVGYFARVAELLFEFKENNQQEPAQKLIAFINQYIQNHLEEELSLTRLASLVNHSPTYLSRLYKRTTGTMLFDFIIEQRMKKAKHLLSDTTMKIHEIASAIGYEAAPYFTRYFKKMFQVTPQQFRDAAYQHVRGEQ
ncbi:response regulator transcription factor [Paenibacillus contaminans]|uniref:DNA-binding response regulator n=1 Tax=Paenibacillus contaminans TaxID=450362 RepID=A0A329M3Q3_9BACL|nr:helix-turn-helix domain-containing protein [Paenibacillus contaminans]RAV14390.1 hypothetical protein DQG23_31335 [Paenibacillus contaminans]